MKFAAILCLFGIAVQSSQAMRCYECVARLGPGESSACLTGEETLLPRVHCIGPSVCAAYHYQTVIPGTPTVNHITRGCQALRYGATCEDIFHDLREKGEILPGQHTCTTCSSDLCNASSTQKLFPIALILVVLILIEQLVLS